MGYKMELMIPKSKTLDRESVSVVSRVNPLLGRSVSKATFFSNVSLLTDSRAATISRDKPAGAGERHATTEFALDAVRG